MNRIEFVVEAAGDPGFGVSGAPRLEISIDGVRLQDLARPVERPLALAEVDGDENEAPPSGGYAGGFVEAAVAQPSRAVQVPAGRFR